MQTTASSSGDNIKSAYVAGIQEQTITCFFCFEQFDVDIEIGEEFKGRNTEVYDCVVCCNPLNLSDNVYDSEISSFTISDGNE